MNLTAALYEAQRRASSHGLVSALLDSLFGKQRQIATLAMQPSASIALLCGRRAGKSWLVAIVLIALCLTRRDGVCLWLGLNSENIKGIAHPIMRKLLRAFGRLGLHWEYNKVERTYHFSTGSTIVLDGPGNQPLDFADKYLGRPLLAAVIEEGGSWSPSMLDYVIETVLEPGLVDEDGMLTMVGTPRDIMDGPFYNATRGVLTDWTPGHWTALDNPHIADKWQKRIDRKVAANPNYRNTMVHLREDCGQWVKDLKKLVYGEYTTANLFHEWKRHPDDRYTLVLDPGYADAAAFLLTVKNRTVHPGTLRIVDANKFVRMRTDQIAQTIDQYRKEYPGLRLVADPTWTVAADLRGPMYGNLPIVSAQKSQKWSAIADVNTALASAQIEILYHSCVELIDELEKLPTRKNPDGTLSEDKKSGFENHLTDTLLYGWRDARDELILYEQKQETHLQRMRRASAQQRRRQSNWRNPAE